MHPFAGCRPPSRLQPEYEICLVESRLWDHDLEVHRLTEAGLGQHYGTMTLGRTTEAWLAAGAEPRDHVGQVVDGITPHVEVIGSSSVLGLLAKPIIDLAVGLASHQPVAPIATTLTGDG